MSKSIGTLTVDLLLKMGGFEQGMDRASRQTKQRMREISRAVDASAARVRNFVMVGAAAITTGVAITAALVNSARQSIDSQAKLARSLGTTYDSLTALQMRAGDSGIDALDASLNRMNRRLGAVEMNAGPAVKTVKALNLNLKELQDMDVDQRIGLIGDRINEMNLSNEEAARHLQQLGFEQKGALELFKSGSVDIARYRAEVDQLGLSMTELEASKIEAANDALGIFGDIKDAAINRLTAGMATGVQGLADTIEAAWIQTDNFGLASETFEAKFSSALANSLESAANFVDFMNQHGEMMSSFGLIGHFLFGRRGLLIGAVVGTLFSSIRKEMRLLGLGDVDKDAAALERLQSGIRAARAVLDAPRGERGLLSFIEDNAISVAESNLAKLTAQADALRTTMSPDSFAEFNALFVETEDRAEGIAFYMRQGAERIRELQDAGGVRPNYRVPDNSGDDRDFEGLEKLLELYQSQEDSLQRQIALFGDTTMAAAFRYDAESGSLAKLDDEQKARLILLAEEMDILNARALELSKQKDIMKEFASEAARNMQSSLANFLFDPFDKGVKGMLKSFGNVMRQMIAQVVAAQVLKSLFGGFAGSSNSFLAGIGETFAGKKDGGGHVPAGQWAIAGEIGPEIVTGPANVISRADTANMMGGGVQINVINNAGVNVRQTEPRFDGGRQIVDMIIDTVKTGMGQGSLDDSLSQYFGISRSGGRG